MTYWQFRPTPGKTFLPLSVFRTCDGTLSINGRST